MAELQPVHRYAAAALLSLALHQAQAHQSSLPHQPDGLVISPEHDLRKERDCDGHSENLWTSQATGLLRPIFRFLKIDSKAWVGLEQTALSSDAKFHIVAFLRILSEEEDCARTSNTAETKLSEAVDNLALKFENASPLASKSKENILQNEEVLGSADDKGATQTKSVPMHASDSSEFLKSSTSPDTITSPQNSSLIREDYFAATPTLIEGHNESEESTGTALVSKMVNRSQSIGLGEESFLEYISPKGSLVAEGRLPTEKRKVAVLFELLSAVVADVPAENGEDDSRRRRGYDARQRVALRLLATWLDVKWTKVAAMEVLVAYAAMAAQQDVEEKKDEKEKENKSWARWKRGGLIGAAAVTGGALLALTGGLAAPAIAAGLSALAPTLGTIVPVIGSTGFAAAAAAAGSTVGSVAVAASFGAAGAGLTGSKMARRTGGVEEFGFEGLGENHQQGRLAVGIAVSGFLNDSEDFTKPWKGRDSDLEMYALRWETKTLMALSTAIQDWLTSSNS